jgi:glycine cleavage system H protein
VRASGAVLSKPNEHAVPGTTDYMTGPGNPAGMSFEVPEDCRYLETHEWVRLDDGSGHGDTKVYGDDGDPDEGDEVGTARVGISDFAQDELGDVVFVELPEAGDQVEQDDDFGVVESIKAVSDLYAPVSGTVAATNDRLVDEPELVNEDPYGDGWMLELEDVDEADLDALLSPEEYRAQIE